MIHKYLGAAFCTVAAIAIAGCGGAATGGPALVAPNPVATSYSSLQFAVGTANLYGTSVGLNVVSTFRQNNGASATGVNTPMLTGPFAFTAKFVGSGFGSDPYTTLFNGGPSYTEAAATATIEGTSQTVEQGTPACDGSGAVPVPCPAGMTANTTTFGQSGGVFAMGIAPYNAVPNTGQAYSYAPYPQPIYAAVDATSSYAFVPWGGPPAFDPDADGMGERDGLAILGHADSFGFPYFLGVAEGITAFDGVTPSSGTYTLNVAISTLGSGGVSTSTISKSASLNVATVLPALTTPAFSADGNGGGSVTVALPAGVTEAYVQIVDYGPGGGPKDGAAKGPANCQGSRGTSFAPVYYTLHVTAAGPVSLPDSDGPNTSTTGGKTSLTPSPSICTAAQNTASNGTSTNGDDIVVQMIGFDYPIYAAALGLTQSNTPKSPTITGASGQADITVAQAAEQDDGGTAAAVPLLGHRFGAPAIYRIRH